MIKAVIFDHGNTLVEYYRRNQFPGILKKSLDLCAAVLADAGLDGGRVEDVWARAMIEDYEDKSLRVRPLEDRLTNLFQLPPVRAGSVMDALCDAFCVPISETARLYEDTLACLEAVRQRELKAAVLTNTPWGVPSRCWSRDVVRHGIGQYLDAVVCCRDVGWRKPARQAFDYTLGVLGLKPDEAVMVGDSVRWDIEGALNCGIAAVHLDRLGEGGPSVTRIRSLFELIPVLDGLDGC